MNVPRVCCQTKFTVDQGSANVSDWNWPARPHESLDEHAEEDETSQQVSAREETLGDAAWKTFDNSRWSSWDSDPLSLSSSPSVRKTKSIRASASKWGDLPRIETAAEASRGGLRTHLIKEGVLLQQEMTWPRNWGQRHLVLHPHCLICYEDFTARVLRKEKAKMYLSHVCKAFTHDELRFTVCEGSGRQRVWTFQADSEQKKMEWIAAIKTQIEKSNTNNDKSESCQSTQGFGGMEEETYQEISQVSEVLTDISSINVNESLKEHCGDSVTTCSVDVSQTETREKEDIGREGKERGNEQLSSSAGSVGDLRKEAQQEEGERVMSSQPRRRLVRGEINGLIGKRLFEEGLRYWNLYSTRTARSMRAEPESSFSSRPMRLEPPLESKVIVTGEEEEEEEGGGSGSKCGLYMVPRLFQKRSRVYPMDGTRIAKKV